MKIRSLVLGSLAVAGLSTTGYAADLGVVTSLDLCDELDIVGLAISSDDNCLVITGGVTFEYSFGDYNDLDDPVAIEGRPAAADNTANDEGRPLALFDRAKAAVVAPAVAGVNLVRINAPGGGLDSSSDVDAWLKFVATAPSDFGPATATIKLISENGTGAVDQTVGIDEAWVGIGDTTMIMAGYKASIFADGDDVPLNYLGLFNSDNIDKGVGFSGAAPATGGNVIQVVSNLGNGISVGAGVEGLQVAGVMTGVGVVSYAGEGITAHASGALATNGAWKVHSGFTGTWDPITVVGAFAADSGGYWNALGSAKATFDIFTLAVAGEATSGGEFGLGGSASVAITDGVTLNFGGRYFRDVTDPDVAAQVEAGISAKATETITVSAAIGAIGGATSIGGFATAAIYGKAGLAWAPGGGFDLSLNGEANTLGAYKGTFKASKSIK